MNMLKWGTIIDNGKEILMKYKIILIAAISMLVLAACGSKSIDESITLKDHENNEVAFPQENQYFYFL